MLVELEQRQKGVLTVDMLVLSITVLQTDFDNPIVLCCELGRIEL